MTSAKKEKFCAARAAWPFVCAIGRPVSNVSSSAIRAPRALIASAIRRRTRARSAGSSCGHGPCSNARRAAATARSTSATSPAATSAYGSFVTGSAVGNVRPLALGTCSPPM
jgi:hypothetical protein